MFFYFTTGTLGTILLPRSFNIIRYTVACVVGGFLFLLYLLFFILLGKKEEGSSSQG